MHVSRASFLQGAGLSLCQGTCRVRLRGLRAKTLTFGQRAANLEQGRARSPELLGLRLLEGPGGPVAGRAAWGKGVRQTQAAELYGGSRGC